MYVVDYSAKSIALFGPSQNIKEVLKERFKAKFNNRLTDPSTNTNQVAGWIMKSSFKGMATKKKDLIGYFKKDGGSFSSTLTFYKQFKEEINIRLKNKQNIFLIIFVILLNYSMKLMKNKKRSFSIKECIHLIKICIQN